MRKEVLIKVTMIASCVFLDKVLVEEPGMLEAMRVHQRRTIQEKVQETVQVQEEIHIQMAMDVMTA